MTIKQLNKVDSKLAKTYENQITTNIANVDFVDRTDLLLEQMTFIALNNKNFFKF